MMTTTTAQHTPTPWLREDNLVYALNEEGDSNSPASTSSSESRASASGRILRGGAHLRVPPPGVAAARAAAMTRRTSKIASAC